MGKVENDLSKLIEVEVSRLGGRVFRNNNGKVETFDGRWIEFGLGPGSPDLFGWAKGGRTLGIEVKGPKGSLSPEQRVWQRDMIQAGCIHIVARSVQNVTEVLENV